MRIVSLIATSHSNEYPCQFTTQFHQRPYFLHLFNLYIVCMQRFKLWIVSNQTQGHHHMHMDKSWEI